jgi:hypothetical protein
MKALFSLAVLLLIGIVAVGFYRGWFQVSTNNTENKSNATITVDKDKIRVDEGKAKEKVEELEHKTK